MQLIGTKKCPATRAAERFFRDRGIAFHFVDLGERGLSKGELEALRRGAGGKSLIDETSPAYKKRGLAYMDYDELEELLENPLLLVTPVVREGAACIVGKDEKAWKALAEKLKA